MWNVMSDQGRYILAAAFEAAAERYVTASAGLA